MNSTAYSPDIVERIDTLSRKAQDKKKVLQDFLGILQDRANLEDYYSRNLEKISESLTKLIHGRDHMKELFFIIRNYVSIQAEQSRGLARAIKNEVAFDIQAILNNDIQVQRDSQNISKRHNKDIKEYVDKLNYIRNEYISSVQEDQRIQQNSQFKKKLPKTRQNYEESLKQYIEVYNNYIEQYFSDIAQVQDSFTKLELDRRVTLQDTAIKLIMYEVSLVRNLQYDLNGISNKIEQFNPKTDLVELFKETASDKPLLSKLNFANYLSFLHQQLRFDPKEHIQTDERIKKRKPIFNEPEISPAIQNIIKIPLEGTDPVLVKMFQNALFNNVVPDEGIQSLKDSLINNPGLLNQFVPSLERVLSYSVNQQQGGRYEVTSNGYMSLIRVFTTFLDRMDRSLTNDFVKAIKITNDIYKKVQLGNDVKMFEEITVTNGLSNHAIYLKVDFWIQWGKYIIEYSQKNYEEKQDELLLNEDSKIKFIIKPKLLEYNKCMKELGCSDSLCTLTKKELVNLTQASCAIIKK